MVDTGASDESNSDDADMVWLPLEIALTKSEFLEMVHEALLDDVEISAVEDLEVQVTHGNTEPTFVARVRIQVESGMTAVERAKLNTFTHTEFDLRTNPT